MREITQFKGVFCGKFIVQYFPNSDRSARLYTTSPNFSFPIDDGTFGMKMFIEILSSRKSCRAWRPNDFIFASLSNSNMLNVPHNTWKKSSKDFRKKHIFPEDENL
ncbi:hypothetical protein TIFTF001_017102 [Ficus carica]|uniref:Uncharacterized protein n=1 Tax=Ficus carica TaxID=3494 RepID=A0AA88AKM7_FICCA|nr:hypothetical protein TIFTF001_017102 [Ficus carica]